MIDRRENFGVKLHPLYKIKYDKLCRMLPDRWQPISGFRPIDEQASLYRQGRSEKGPACNCKDKINNVCQKHLFGLTVTNARPGLSFHNYGIATDWGFFEGSVWIPMPFNDPRWVEYLAACRDVGLRVLDFERPHNEIKLPCPIHVVYDAFLDGSYKGAEKRITEVLI